MKWHIILCHLKDGCIMVIMMAGTQENFHEAFETIYEEMIFLNGNYSLF